MIEMTATQLEQSSLRLFRDHTTLTRLLLGAIGVLIITEIMSILLNLSEIQLFSDIKNGSFTTEDFKNMAAQKGKDLLLKVDTTGAGAFTTVAGLRSRTFAVNAETVDVTHTESAGQWRELLSGAGVRSVSVSAAEKMVEKLSK